MSQVQLYDTILRDGVQREGISFSVVDKLNIAEKLDELGIHFVTSSHLEGMFRTKARSKSGRSWCPKTS